MKNIIAIAFVMLTMVAFGQKEKKIQEVVIHTSAECGSCKERIEEKLNYTAGVKFAELDVPSHDLTVKFQTAKISLEEIKKILSELGYDADEVKADPKAYEALPTCCKVGGMEHQD